MNQNLECILNNEILLAITFVFGVVHLITLTKVFNNHLVFLNEVLNPNLKIIENKYFNFTKVIRNFIVRYYMLFGVWFFYLSLCHQAWYWLFR